MQRNRGNTKKFRSIVILLLAIVMISSSGISQMANTVVYADTTESAPTVGKPIVQLDEFEPYYSEVLTDWEAQGHKNASSSLTIPGTSMAGQSDPNGAKPGSYEGKNNVLIWTNDRDNWVEFKVNVPEAGFYVMNLNYHPYNDPERTNLNRRPIVLSVSVNGKFPYREARAITFTRLFKDDLPVKQDINGDDIRPRPLEIKQWMSQPFRDTGYAYTEPLKWYFKQGENTVRLAGYESIVIDSITLEPPTTNPSYEQVKAAYPTDRATSTESVIIQAENMDSKNDVAIQMVVDRDYLSVPRSIGKETFNTVGGARWAKGGQEIEWKFIVPENGLYKISMRALQNVYTNMSTHRAIKIDGKVPFKELEAYSFPFSSKWVGTTLTDENGDAYEFYLEAGEHTLSMEATYAPFQQVIIESEYVASLLRDVDQELKSMTGGVIDKNRTWRIRQEFPELIEKIQAVRDELVLMGELLLEANGKRDNMVQTIYTTTKDIENILRYPDEIPYYMEDISALQERIGTVRDTLTKAPLQLDQIYITPSAAALPKLEANFFERMRGMVTNFFYSFIRKDDISDLDKEALNVWVNRGRDYVNLLQELADNMFTPEYGTKVKVNLLPDENLLIYANAAGINPDIALGQPQDKSIDFAMRNALLDLSEFPDFEEVTKDFAPGALLPFFYNDGYYALPETQSFKVMFYRKDILQNLGLGIPDTWEDVYEMMPTLQQNGYNFYIPHTDFITFFYQNGAEFFAADGMSSAIDTPEGFRAFKMWTDLFNIYDVERNVPSFYQHFRKGTMPIGVADYNTYVTLSVAAPEITGWWGVAPLPGVKQSDGTVARWSAGGQTTGFIYKSSEKKEEAWTFLKWLLSPDIQEQYGMDLESFNGIEFRWNTAVIEAFTQLPWQREDLQVILEQWRWYKEVPNLPGSYFIARELNNAWNRTVVDGMNYRESLEQAVVNIDREMIRKSQEFGFVDSEGKILHTLDLPIVDKPWEGVDRFATK